jgi:S-adenosylmethionine decarboxylase
MDEKSYGLHLMLDAYGALGERLSDMALLYRTLAELPGLIGMRRVGLPQVLEVDEEGIAGLSGFVFIMESHISIHTYSERGFITIDIYSCKDFDHGKAAAYLREVFAFSSADIGGYRGRGARQAFCGAEARA